MKLIPINTSRSRPRHGTVVLVLLVFITLMTMLCAATWREVHLTRQEIFLIDKHQNERLAATTNTPPVATKSLSAP